MFATIENGIITLDRGDTLYTPIKINAGTKMNPVPYTLTENDTLYFALLEPNQSFENAIVKKVYNSTSEKDECGNTLLKLETEDTECLSAGKYYYTVKLRSGNKLTTLIQLTIFNIIGTSYPGISDEYDDIDEADHIIYEGGEWGIDGDLHAELHQDKNTQRIIYEGGELRL